MSVKQLQSELRSRNLSSAGLLEKSDFVDRLLEIESASWKSNPSQNSETFPSSKQSENAESSNWENVLKQLEAGNVKAAVKWFDAMKDSAVLSQWEQMIEGIWKAHSNGQTDDLEVALDYWDELENAGLRLESASTYNVLIAVLAKRKDPAVFDLFTVMLNDGIEPTLNTYVALVQFCHQSGDYSKMEGLRTLMQSQKHKLVPALMHELKKNPEEMQKALQTMNSVPGFAEFMKTKDFSKMKF
eukprot:CAMPEP_0175130422 /NCGR_PEP_ID=MMETSP0087-20121206/5998_1 /TAXON_ID=136419 /ORGANISM="Unknown Unknown, Strain D1" /LENGTH=242 /DNA_ID=CAMNT_0016412639 /DNA_START=134 /DNA_END=862 /DNA_ORIENTATION=+